MKRIIKESVKKVLKESEIEIPDDIPVVNPEAKSEGYPLYCVGLWWGSGYYLDRYCAYANCEEAALGLVVAYIEKTEPETLKASDACAEDYLSELEEEQGCSREEAEKLPEFYETFFYWDATMEGANKPHYLWHENFRIERVQ